MLLFLGSPRHSRPHTTALLCICAATVAGLSLIRLIFATKFDLRVDEAYYWTWVREYVVSYLDHPPLIVWLLRLSTSVFGDTNLGVRFPGLLAVALTQFLLGAIIWRMVRDLRYVAAIVLMTEASLAYGLGTGIAQFFLEPRSGCHGSSRCGFYPALWAVQPAAILCGALSSQRLGRLASVYEFSWRSQR